MRMREYVYVWANKVTIDWYRRRDIYTNLAWVNQSDFVRRLALFNCYFLWERPQNCEDEDNLNRPHINILLQSTHTYMRNHDQ